MPYIGAGIQKFNTADGLTVSGSTELDGAVVVNESSADADFRVESNGNANMLFVDAGNDKVAIGTGTAVGTLTTECTAGNSNFALTAYHPTSTSSRTIAKFQSDVGSTQADVVTIGCDGGITTTGALDVTTSTHANASVFKSTGNTQLFLQDTDATANDQFWGFQVSGGSLNILTCDDDRSGGFLTPLVIGSGGDIFVGQSSTITPGSGNTTHGTCLQDGGRLFLSADGVFSLGLNRSDNGELTNFHRAGVFKGSINITASAVSYNTSSDVRLKENIIDMTGAIDRVKQLAPKRFNFIEDADNTVDGLLAHETQTVVPEAITGTHNEVDDDGNPVYQQIDQSKLVPLLVGALKESIAKIETLETEMTALKARVTALEDA